MNRIRIPRSAGAGEPVHVWLRPGGDVPDEFVWRGQRHRVRSIESEPRAASRRDGRRRLRMTTSTGLRCILVQEPGIGSWKMDRLVGTGGSR